MSAQTRDNRKNVQVKVRLPKVTHQVLSAIATHKGVIRAALADYVAEQKASDER